MSELSQILRFIQVAHNIIIPTIKLHYTSQNGRLATVFSGSFYFLIATNIK